MKKRLWLIPLVLVLVAAAVLVFGRKSAPIDCGTSTRYTQEDLERAGKIVADQIRSFDGCELYSVTYAGDEVSAANLDYCNELAAPGTVYVDCVVFDSSFHSPVAGGGAWEPDTDYAWSWYLARTDGGAWELLTYGYG